MEISRARLLLLLALVVPLGFATKLLGGSSWVGAHAGGLFYVVFWVLLVLACFPRLSPGRVAAAVVAITCLLEVLQLWQPPWLTTLRSGFVGRTLLGSTFGWSDFPWYFAGGLCAFLATRALRRAADPA